jgi:vitamin B12 transporter|nr:TonB-dependent receptor [Spirochaetales bacterium]
MGSTTSIFMRGASYSDRHVLILVDGIEQTDPSGFGPNIANIHLDNVQQIEILKGAQSGVWGANASAGVINIITQKGQKQASVLVEVGSNNSQKIATTLGDGNEQFDFVVHFSTTDTDGFSAIKPFNKSADDYEADGFKQTDLSFKMGMYLGTAHRIETLVKSSSANNEYDGTTGWPNFTPNPDDLTSSNTFDSTTRQIQYLYQQDQLNGRLFINENQIKTSFSSGYQAEGIIESFGGQLGYQYRMADTLSLSTSKNHFRNVLGDNEYFNTGFAASNTNHIGKNLVLTESLRHDEYDEFENATTGKIGIKNHFTDQLFVSANYGTGYNAPALYQLSTPNPVDLKPESVESYDFTLGLYGLELTYFNTATEDLIAAEGFWPTNYYVNSEGTTHTDGWELSYLQNISAIESDLSIGSTWLSAKNGDDQLKAYIPQHQASINLDYYGLAKTHFGLETRYTGLTYSADNNAGAQIGDYYITDFKVDYQVNKHLTLYSKVLNVFDEDYATSVADYPATNIEPNYVYSNGGRQFFIGLRGQL